MDTPPDLNAPRPVYQLVEHRVSLPGSASPGQVSVQRFEVPETIMRSACNEPGVAEDSRGALWDLLGFTCSGAGPMSAQLTRLRNLATDPTFAPSSGGVVEVPNLANGALIRVAATLRGAIVLGYDIVGGEREYFLQAFTDTGEPDTVFGGGGRVRALEGVEGTQPIPGKGGGATALNVTSSGQVVVAFIDQANLLVRVKRFTAQGAPDPDFGVRGDVDLRFSGALSLYTAGVFEDKAGRTYLAQQLDEPGVGSNLILVVSRFATDAADTGVSIAEVAPARAQSGRANRSRRVTMSISAGGPRSSRRVVARVALPAGVTVRVVDDAGMSCAVEMVRRTRYLACRSALMRPRTRKRVVLQLANAADVRLVARVSASAGRDVRSRNNTAVLGNR